MNGHEMSEQSTVVVSGAGTGRAGGGRGPRLRGREGGTANVVAPGFVPDTGFWSGRLSAESRQQRASQTLVGREGTPDEVAALIGWLLGPDGGWMTGQVLSPNGGVVLGR
jgi:3-oxoacyl-[acyl-carrier protein] reductase